MPMKNAHIHRDIFFAVYFFFCSSSYKAFQLSYRQS